MHICRTALAVALFLVAAPWGLAQPGPRVVKMTLHPTAPSIPAMKYALLPEVRDLHQGNAAVNYHRTRSPEWEHVLVRYPDYAHFHEWLDLPLADVPLDRIKGGVIGNMLKELDIAARTEHCDFQMLPRIREEGPALLIPDMQGFRSMVVLLALRSRAEMRDGKLDRAVQSFQTGMAMSKHIGETPTLITYLIGVACANVTLDRIEEFVQQPGAPNLYWPLTDLPRPLIDIRRPLQGERVLIDSLFPEIRQALQEPRSGPIPAHKLRATLEKLAMMGIRHDSVVSAATMASTYPRAKKFLIDQGRSAEDIAALPVTQVALMYSVAQYDRWTDESYKLNNLPYWVAGPQAKELHKQWQASASDYRSTLGPIVSLWPVGSSTKARLQRRVDLLRCVEAVRLYAAAHKGALPATLEEIREVPIPEDPFTGKAFRYIIAGNRATLEAPPPPGEEASDYNAIRIEITLAPQK